MKINNVPSYAKDYRYIVATEVDNEYWFYGAFNDEEKAYDVAIMINGIVNNNF